ncbi:metallophosphoesterase family protein [Synechocystis sp. PCC 6714]|uniref:purple acid phosphatase family protein n=2 Tax=unclassified Synechocystis TaxID=2640012 RepID=UPI0004D1D992|nr:metallophosphoesterase family protein [Synechocystis sp. PCC 6714]AIE74349.1 hypothetical protein D082_18210 [Synechocystis sp. PCC 6714]
MLSDPFLQLPTPDSVQVVWFTEFAGDNHWVQWGHDLEHRTKATTQQLSRTREDEWSYTFKTYDQLSPRPIWRHQAVITGLTTGETLPYQVFSEEHQQIQHSEIFSLQPSPPAEKPLKILLTSDHQLMPMVAANIQQAIAVYGDFDAVFHAGDMVNVPDRASEWFDDRRGRSFFPVLQGRASVQLGNRIYHGGQILQSTPMFPCPGNHEVMGRNSQSKALHLQFKDARPQAIAEEEYFEQQDFSDQQYDPVQVNQWIQDHSFNFQTYREIFSLPPTPAPEKQYYAVSFGNIRLVSLMVTNVWRSAQQNLAVAGRYQESDQQLHEPENWGHGQHIFEPITPGSRQYEWLKEELGGEAFRQAKYKIVMFHHPPHSLGGNVTPPYTDPQPYEEYSPNGTMVHRRYHYPKGDDQIIKYLIPLLENAGVQLVFYGHSHLWNRFVSPRGTHFLETSNVGNSYGAHLADNPRSLPDFIDPSNDFPVGNPNGLSPVIPTIAPLLNDEGEALPYIASNKITVFSVLETNDDGAVVKSYYFDTIKDDSEVVLFDQFILRRDD